MFLFLFQEASESSTSNQYSYSEIHKPFPQSSSPYSRPILRVTPSSFVYVYFRWKMWGRDEVFISPQCLDTVKTRLLRLTKARESQGKFSWNLSSLPTFICTQGQIYELLKQLFSPSLGYIYDPFSIVTALIARLVYVDRPFLYFPYSVPRDARDSAPQRFSPERQTQSSNRS